MQGASALLQAAGTRRVGSVGSSARATFERGASHHQVTTRCVAGGAGAGGGSEKSKKKMVQRRALRGGSPLAPGEPHAGKSHGVSRAVFNDADTTTTQSWQRQGGWNDTATPFPSQISVENPWDQDTTLVRCKGFDRVIQLATLTTSISSFGLDIKSAFIRPESEPMTVDDMFYVTTRDGEQLSAGQHEALVKHMEMALGLHDHHRINHNEKAHRDEEDAGRRGQRGHQRAEGSTVYDTAPQIDDFSGHHHYGRDIDGGHGKNGHHHHDQPHQQHHHDQLHQPHQQQHNGGRAALVNYSDPDYDPENDRRHGWQPRHQTPTSDATTEWYGGDAGIGIGGGDHYDHYDLAQEHQQQEQQQEHSPEPVVSFFDKQATSWAPSAPPAEPPASALPQEAFGHQNAPNFDYTLTPRPYRPPTQSEPIPADAAAVLSAQLRVAAAEMAAAAAEFVQLERERASAMDPSEIERLQQPRLDAQATLEQTMHPTAPRAAAAVAAATAAEKYK